MSEPILFLLDDDPEVLAALAGALERRFGADYRVLTDRSPAGALARLQQARDRGEEIVLAIVDQWMADMTGIGPGVSERGVTRRIQVRLTPARGGPAPSPPSSSPAGRVPPPPRRPARALTLSMP